MKKFVCFMVCILCLASFGGENRNILANGDVKKVVPLKEYKAKYPQLRMDVNLEGNVPEGWGLFRAGRNDVGWGISKNVKYQGKNAVFMKGLKGKGKFRYLILGDSDGYHYSYLPVLKPGKEYLFSVKVQGNVGTVRAMIMTKVKGFDTVNHKVTISYNNLIHCREGEWTVLAGKFKTPEKESRLAIGLLAQEMEKGRCLYAADAKIVEAPPIVKRERKGAAKVGIYAPEKELPRFREKIRECLNQNGFRAELITDLRWETIRDLDALVLTTFRERSEKDKRNDNIALAETDIAGNLLHFVNRGGGLILGHDCVGLRGKLWEIPLFPEILRGQKIVMDSSVKPLKGKLPGIKAFTHSYYDHVAIRTGKRGMVQAVDGKKNPVIVYGAGVRGRIAGIGYPMGVDHKDRSLPDLIPEEKSVLISAVKWAASAPKYEVDRLHTVCTSAMEYHKKAALKGSGELQRRAAEEKKYSTLPLPKLDEISMIMANKVNDTEQALRQRIRNVRKVGFNTIKMHVNNGHSLYYNSKKFPRCKAPHCKFDTLAVAKDECNKLGMKFAVFIHSFASLRNYKRPCGCDLPRTLLKHEYEKIQSGEKKASSLDKEWAVLASGRKSVRWECPGNESNLRRYETMVREVVQTYKPFEINFDFVRYQLGYEMPCYCRECLERKAAYGKKHPALKEGALDKAFAEYELKRIFNRLFKAAREADSKVLVSCYTYAENCDWIFSYDVDRHLRYVSGRIGPDTPLSGIVPLMKKYTFLLKKYNPKAELLPLLVNYDSKNGVRMQAEFSLVSQGWDAIKPKLRTVEFAGYGYLFEPVLWLKRDKPEYDAINGISRALQGSWHKNEGKLHQ